MTQNVQDFAPVKVECDPLLYTGRFTYLGSTVRHDGGAGSDIHNRIGKARNAFRMLNPLWKSQQYKTHTKLKLYKSCVLSTLLYGFECWRMTENDLLKLSSFQFHTKNVQKIVRYFSPHKKTHQDLLDQCQQERIEIKIPRRRWIWIGHNLRKDRGSIARVAVEWQTTGTQSTRAPKDDVQETYCWGRDDSHGTFMGHVKGLGSGPPQMEGLCGCPSCLWLEGRKVKK